MSLNLLRKSMPVAYSPQWDGRSRNVAYMEAFGRVFAGLSPWLNLNDNDSREGQLRNQVREWTLASCVHAVDLKVPDYLEWEGEPQALVDAAYFVTDFFTVASRDNRKTEKSKRKVKMSKPKRVALHVAFVHLSNVSKRSNLFRFQSLLS